MKLDGKSVWILNVYTWGGLTPGAKHWYWELYDEVNYESYGRSESRIDVLEADEDIKKGSCLTRADAIREGVNEFLRRTVDGVEGVLVIGKRPSIKMALRPLRGIDAVP